MKKLLLIAFLLISYCCVKAQQTFLFKLKYLPDHLYESTTKRTMNMEMNFSGDSAAMAKIKAEGIKLPMIINSNTNMDIEARTGTLKGDNIFPIILTYKNIIAKKTINGAESAGTQNPLLGQKIYAQYTTDGKIEIDSISGKVLDEKIKAVLEKTITSLINQIKFPDHPLRIGEEFTQEIPLNIPVGGVNMDMAVKIIYKLNHVDNGLAYFDLNESLSLNMKSQQAGVTMVANGEGKGNGALVYNIDQNFTDKMYSNMKFNFAVNMGKLNINAEASILSQNSTVISGLSK